MKFLILAIILTACQGKRVQRIIRQQYNVTLSFQNQSYKRLAVEEFRKINQTFQAFNETFLKCIDRNIASLDRCHDICLGQQFWKLNEAAELHKVKVESLVDTLFDILFNENCMTEENRHQACLKMLTDAKFLRNNGFNVIKSLLVNKDNYVKGDV